jgi:hypothetical protein
MLPWAGKIHKAQKKLDNAKPLKHYNQHEQIEHTKAGANPRLFGRGQ